MVYLISIEQGFNLFRQSIYNNNPQQYSIWINTINKTFDFILTEAYKKGNKDYENLKKYLFNFVDKYNASDLFSSERLCSMITSKLTDLKLADILTTMKLS